MLPTLSRMPPSGDFSLPVVLAFGLLGLILLGLSPTVLAHKGETHDPGVSVSLTNSPKVSPALPFAVGGSFSLQDHFGQDVTNETYLGKHMLVFFGYTQCRNMCSLSLTRVGKALDMLGDDIDQLSPLVITVDPERDTPERLRSELPKYHSALIGLTGDDEQLGQAYSSYNQTPQDANDAWLDDVVISHSSYIYLLDQAGQFVTLFPPILNPESMSAIIRKYLHKEAS